MIICFDANQETHATLEELKESGGYADYSEVIRFAVQNLAVLQRTVREKGAIVFDDRNSRDVVNDDVKSRQGAAAELPSLVPGVPRPFARRLLLQRAAVRPVVPAADLQAASASTVPIDKWIFGQFSKLLPAKATVRALANYLVVENLDTAPLIRVAPLIAADATKLGDYLASVDARLRLDRDQALAFGFPTTGENSDKSRLRYANQYVAAVNRDGVASGLLVNFKLANITDAGSGLLGLTSAGWNFAILPNPILDVAISRPESRLSDEERDFLLVHIKSCVPVENSAYRTVLRAVADGINTPDELDDHLRSFVSQDREKPITGEFITTQRSGVVSRMVDLRLIERSRVGPRVSYRCTEAGDLYLRQADGANK